MIFIDAVALVGLFVWARDGVKKARDWPDKLLTAAFGITLAAAVFVCHIRPQPDMAVVAIALIVRLQGWAVVIKTLADRLRRR